MTNGKRKTGKKKIVWMAVAGFVLLFTALQIFSGGNPPGITVQTDKAVRRDITQLVSATGTINPVHQVVITPEVTGEIVELPVKEGDTVQKNQLLIRIKPDSYLAQRDRAQANLDSAQATLKIKQIEKKRLEEDVKRTRQLFQNDISNKQDLDRMEADLAAARVELEAQTAYVQQAEASLKEAVESLNKTAIYSPMDGTVSKLNVERGERVLGSGFSQGTDLMTVADLSRMEATINVDENDVVLVKIGDKARIELDAFRNTVYNGEVTQIANSAVTRAAGTQEEVVNFAIQIALGNFTDPVRPGMSCNADIEVETRNDVLTIPIQSVTARSEKDEPEETAGKFNDAQYGKTVKKKQTVPKEVVFLAGQDTVTMTEVKIGISDNEYVEIVTGLREGDEVVSGPYRAISSDLEDQSKIRREKKKKDGKTAH